MLSVSAHLCVPPRLLRLVIEFKSSTISTLVLSHALSIHNSHTSLGKSPQGLTFTDIKENAIWFNINFIAMKVLYYADIHTI